MATTPVDILLRVRDEASAQLKNLAGGLNGTVGIAQRLSAAFGGSSASLLSFGTAATGVIGVVIAAGIAATGFAKKLSDDIEQLDNLSARTGVSAKNLQILQFAFRQGGVDADSLTQGLNFMQRAIDQNSPALQKLGVTSRDTFEAFMQAARGLSGMSDSAARAHLIFEVFGRGGSQMIPIMNQLAGGFDGVAAAATRSGNVLNDEQLEKFRQLDAQFDELSASVEGFGKQLAVAVAGPMVKFGQGLQDLIDKATKLKSLGLGGLFHQPNGAWPQSGMGSTSPAQVADDPNAQLKALVRWNGRSFPGEGGSALRGGGPGSSPLSVGPLLDEAKTHLITFNDLMDQVGRKWLESFQTIGQSVYSGIVGVFANISNRAQTFHTAIVSIFQSMVQGVEIAIGQLVASAAVAQLIKLLGIAASFLTGNPIAGIVAGTVSDSFGIGAKLTAGGSAPAPLSAMSPQGGGNTYVFQTLAPKEIFQSLVSPHGSMRSAYDRLAEVAAAS